MHLDHKTFLNVLEDLKCQGHSPRGDTEKRNIAHVFADERYVADLPTVEAPHFICQPCVSTVSVEEKNLVKFLELQNLYFYFIIAQNREETN